MIHCPTDWSGRSRRRRWYSQSGAALSESMPLEIDARCDSPNYSTFSNRHNKQQDPLPCWWFLLSRRLGESKDNRKCDQDPYKFRDPLPSLGGPFQCRCSCKIVVFFLICLWLVYYNHNQNQDPSSYHRRAYTPPESQWDHNIYAPLTSSPGDSGVSVPFQSPPTGRVLLIAQLGGQLELSSITDITSRPNRAYARQHGMNYVRYSRGGKSQRKSCFDKVILLNTILDNQAQTSDVKSLPSIFSPPPRIAYDAIALFPPDSIVTNLDYNIFDLLPSDKLVAVAGWRNRQSEEQSSFTFTISKTDLILFNLRHRHANAVAKIWQDLVEPEEVSCDTGNDLTLLIDAVSVVLDNDEDLASNVLTIDESEQGFVNKEISNADEVQDQVIKGLIPSIPESRASMLLSNLPRIKLELQSTADSVCYRYYPRCEVL